MQERQGGDFVNLGDVLKGESQVGISRTEEKSTKRPDEVCEDTLVCQTCGLSFIATNRTRWPPGKIFRIGYPLECGDCREKREEAERQEELRRHELAVAFARGRLRQSCGLPSRFWGETFEVWEGRGWTKTRVFTSLRKWAKEFPIEQPQGYPSVMLFSEEPGPGKTTLIACAINEIIDRTEVDPERPNNPVRYETGPSLSARVRATYDDTRPVDATWRETEIEVYQSLRGVKLLALDDVGDRRKEPASDHNARVYFHIVDDRYGRRMPMILATNSQDSALEEMIGQYTLDRLLEMCENYMWQVKGQTRGQKIVAKARRR